MHAGVTAELDHRIALIKQAIAEGDAAHTEAMQALQKKAEAHLNGLLKNTSRFR